ncbi:MAG: hypothetical protein F4Z04_00825 [Acidobacteria bacterium]|nr:hypothetical protein [Acidobacteriota bacterium]
MIGICRHDAAVHEAIRTGEWTPALRQHASGCARCGEAVAIGRLLNAMPSPEPSARKADVLWWQAQLTTRNARAERVHRTLAVMETVAVSVAGAVGLGALIWALQPVLPDPTILRTVFANIAVPPTALPDLGAIPDAAWVGAGLLVSLAAVFANRVWRDA